MNVQDALRLVEHLPEHSNRLLECQFEVPSSEEIFLRAEKRYARSAAKKMQMIQNGYDDFYRIAEHRSLYLN